MKTCRNEALNCHNNTKHGSIIFSASFPLTLFSESTLILHLCILLFAYYSNNTRKVRLTGIIRTSSELVKITPQYAGYITRLIASEGQHVTSVETRYHVNGEHYNGQDAGILEAMNA